MRRSYTHRSIVNSLLCSVTLFAAAAISHGESQSAPATEPAMPTTAPFGSAVNSLTETRGSGQTLPAASPNNAGRPDRAPETDVQKNGIGPSIGEARPNFAPAVPTTQPNANQQPR